MLRHERWLGCIAGIAGVVLSVLPVRLANAAPADDAKAHYQKATAHFAVGEYREAAVEYEEAFKIKQDPALLYNAAQSFRLAGDNQKALLLYNNLVKLYPSSKFAADSRDHIAKLNAAPAQTSPAAPPATSPGSATATPPPVVPIAPATTPLPAAPPPPATTPVPAVPAPAPAPMVSAPPVTPASPAAEPTRPVYTRWWFWAAAGAVVAAGVVTAVALSGGGSSGSWNNVDPVMGAYVR